MSTADHKFGVAGYSTRKGERTFRFGKDMSRIGVLKNNNHTDIEFWELPHPMTKEEATAWLNAGRPGNTQAATTTAPQKPRASAAKAAQPAQQAEAQAETPPVVANAVQDAFANAVRAAQAGGDVLTDEETAAIDAEVAARETQQEAQQEEVQPAE